MEYNVALQKAWSELKNSAQDKNFSVRFLADEYSVDTEKEQILSLSCNVAAREFVSILILHYLIKKLQGLPAVQGNWISFKELTGGIPYYPAFRKRAIDPIIKKYGDNPKALLGLIERFGAKEISLADTSVVIEAFGGVPVLISLWKGDDEFGPEANVLFDKSIESIFCTEDIAVLAGIIAHSI